MRGGPNFSPLLIGALTICQVGTTVSSGTFHFSPLLIGALTICLIGFQAGGPCTGFQSPSNRGTHYLRRFYRQQ